jgi:hypothetical protein
MKSIEQIFVETCDAVKKAGVTQQLIDESLKLLPTTVTVEQKVGLVKQLHPNPFLRHGEIVSESSRRIKRNNGSGVAVLESDDSRVREYMGRAGCSFREASIIVTGNDPGRGATMSESTVKDLAARWKEYCPALTESECKTLAAKGIEP